MVDYVKSVVPINRLNALLNNDLLEFKEVVNIKTGEVGTTKRAEYNDLKFTIYDNKFILLTGSLHKCYNNGGHNHNDFNYDSLTAVLNDLEDRFKLNLSQCLVQNIEIGLNLQLPFNTDCIIDGLMTHYNKEFKGVSLKSGNYIQVAHKESYIKAYNKGVQYNLDKQIFRFEVKYIRSRKTNIKTLSDLKNKHFLLTELDKVLKEWNKVRLWDYSIKTELLNIKENEIKKHQWSNPKYWIELDKDTRCRENKLFKKMIISYSNQSHKIITQLINYKIVDLLNEI